LKCDGTRAETRFRLPAKRTSPFKSVGASVQSNTGWRAVHISLQGLYCSCKLVFCSHVTLTGYPLHSRFFPFNSPPVRHRVPSHFNWALLDIRPRILVDRYTGSASIPLGALLEESQSNSHHFLQSGTRIKEVSQFRLPVRT
jgi:hypothetical protein